MEWNVGIMVDAEPSMYRSERALRCARERVRELLRYARSFAAGLVCMHLEQKTPINYDWYCDDKVEGSIPGKRDIHESRE